jgi:DNA replication protein DnaC
MTTYPKPERPENRVCRCGVLIEPKFIEPVEIFGRLIFMSNQWQFDGEICSACSELDRVKKIEEQAKESRIKEERLRLENEQSKSLALKKMIGARGFEEFDLKKFNPTLTQNEAYGACVNFNPANENLFIFGPAGVGKTHLAVGVLRNFYLSGIPSIFIKHAALNRSMQGLKSVEYDLTLATYTNADVIVVDDLGTAKRTEFSDQVLYEVLDGRYMAFKNGMIITSNLSLGELAAALGDDRLVSRIAGMCKIINLKGEDFRLKR